MTSLAPEADGQLAVDSVSSYVVRVPRNFERGVGGAGSPSRLENPSKRYSSAKSYSTVYSQEIECLLVKVVAGGYVGWGEAQAPVAPEICHAVVEHLVGPLVVGQSATSPSSTYARLYDAMRVRGHSGGFYLDALAAIDMALWDLLGKITGKPVCDLLGGRVRDSVPSYVSGLLGTEAEECLAYAKERAKQGATAFKVYWTNDFNYELKLMQRLRGELPATTDLFVDTLWRMTTQQAAYYSRALAELRIGWLEAPLIPEDIRGHAWLCSVSGTPIAIGESYRSTFDFIRLVEESAAHILQPDLGRCGITTTRFVTQLCASRNLGFAPHVSISLGPQLAAALHVSAVAPTLIRAESNPDVLAVARKFSNIAVVREFAEFQVPASPGLGIEVFEEKLHPFVTASATLT
ncbi:MAG TPA: mandelate racemase/muconate lactonizing enzyme family protein [Terriglobales bacterium]|nr:mandelate racemase/muconate lactonizing enzyme family protein [Terriglobales bacterium]